MTAESPGRNVVPRGARLYIVGVCALTGIALTVAASQGSIPEWSTLLALLALSAPLWLVGDTQLTDNVTLSLVSVVLLAAAVILGPLGAGLLGVVVVGLTRERMPLWARLFNMAISGLLGVAGGWAYAAAGGTLDPSPLRGPADLVRELAGPLLVADLTQAVLNVLLIGGIMRAAQGVPLRLQAARLLLTSGPVYVGYGILAFLLIVLWFPAGLGPLSVLLLLGPLLGAHWTYRQYTAQRHAQEQSLHVLVGALEHKHPELVGHSDRVADLSARTAEHLGLGVSEVGDIRRAAMLHDLGRLAHPSPSVLQGPPTTHIATARLDRAAQMVEGLSFLAGAHDILDQLGRAGTPESLARQIIVAAAAADMALTFDDDPLAVSRVLGELRDEGAVSARVLDALTWTLDRSPGTP